MMIEGPATMSGDPNDKPAMMWKIASCRWYELLIE